ncbi:MAG: hypothetical protein M0Q91_12200 [Methanoregula sp.]|nr:hypothetical protein [Methanoregula sp.]
MNNIIRWFHDLRREWHNAWYEFMLAHGRCYCGQPIDYDTMYPFCSEACMVKFGKEMR